MTCCKCSQPIPSSPLLLVEHRGAALCFACWLVVTDELRRKKGSR